MKHVELVNISPHTRGVLFSGLELVAYETYDFWRLILVKGFAGHLQTMALVSGVRSTLNPNAPLYIPAAVRKVEDFSPEWWELITTSVWFRDYWLSQHQEYESAYGKNLNNFVGDDIVDMLPDDIDLGVDEDLLTMESQFEEFIRFSGSQESKFFPKDGMIEAKTGTELGPKQGHK